MPRLLAIVLAGLLLGACGAQEGAALRAWEAEAPYFPPRDPSTYAKAPSVDDEPATKDLTPAKEEGPRSAPDADAPVTGAPTDEEIEAQLREAFGGEAGADVDRATLTSDGLATVPQTAPRRLVALIRAANAVAKKPYVYGGGHFRNPDKKHVWEDSAYDCSGSISYALASAGYLDGPMASGPFMTWGKPGKGKWVTIYTNPGHAFMVVAGLRFDTSGRQRTGTRWQPASGRSYAGFVARHPPGL